jgi:hypothetical protein
MSASFGYGSYRFVLGFDKSLWQKCLEFSGYWSLNKSTLRGKLCSTLHWFFWTFVCLPIVWWISRRFVVCFNCVVHSKYGRTRSVQLSWRGVSHCRDSWSRLKNIWEHFVKGSFASLECCWWRASIWRRGALDAIVDIVDGESKVLGSASLCIKFMGFFCV